MNAVCTLSGFPGDPRPSRVVIARPAVCATGVEHDRTALPSISTVQAPHCPSPHPNFTAFKRRELRNTYRSGCAGSHESTVTARPFTRKLYFGMGVSLSLEEIITRAKAGDYILERALAHVMWSRREPLLDTPSCATGSRARSARLLRNRRTCRQ